MITSTNYSDLNESGCGVRQIRDIWPILLLLSLISPSSGTAQDVCELIVDCTSPVAALRALHGVNDGPLHAGGTLDLSGAFRDIGVPLTRLHDCHWPVADVVDIHVVFPSFDADASDPASYDFRRTDDYIQSIVDVGSQVIFRLGESIEHSKRKLHVHPPADVDQWSAICLGIVRHYNAGWADGFHHNIRYWEIWNEPENRPAMWTGDDEDYYRMYAATARLLKQHFPAVSVGGPAVGYAGELRGQQLEPSPFVREFLARCRRDALPLDFFSWHSYTNNPWELYDRAQAVRRLLDESGFQSAESHLNEWNYLPDKDWSPMMAQVPHARQAWFERVQGSEGAAFTAASLIVLQDAPLDAANFYSAANHGFGMFNEYGVPYKNYHAFRAFQQLLATPSRLRVDGTLPRGVALIAGTDDHQSRYNILVSNTAAEPHLLSLRLSLSGERHFAVGLLRLDAQHNLVDEAIDQTVPVELCLPPASVALIQISEK